jgi:hypothetical protein
MEGEIEAAFRPSRLRGLRHRSKGDYLLAVKANQPTLFDEITRYCDDPALSRH